MYLKAINLQIEIDLFWLGKNKSLIIFEAGGKIDAKLGGVNYILFSKRSQLYNQQYKFFYTVLLFSREPIK